MNLSTNPLFTHGINKLCTICQLILRDADTSKSLFSTLEEVESPMNVLQVLQSFSNFNFCNGAQMVCTMCYEKTIELYKFIQMCNKAHDNMQHYLKNIEASKAIKDIETYVKIEEISIEPTRIIVNGREFLEEMENEKISKMDGMETVISGIEIKIEESILEEGFEKAETSNSEGITMSHTEIVIEEKKDSSDIDAHIHDERMCLIKCKDCHLVFSDKKELSAHRKEAKHTKEKPLLSEMCNSFLGTHYNLRSRNRNAKREHISEDLRLNQDLHQPLKDREIDVECPQCQEVFYNDKQLKIHMRRRHKKKFMCNDCGKVFTTKQYLNAHNHVHTGENPFTCLVCQRVFAAPTSLRNHMMIHNGVKPHKCEQCDRRFTQTWTLRRHMVIHNGVKAHKCEQCDWRFTQAWTLRRHMMIHNGVKAYKCEQCDRRFTQASDLRTHMNIHYGVKPHKCEQCDRRFTVSSNLRRHMVIHNGVEAHKCEQCDWRFTQASDLRRHMMIHNRKLSYKCDQCEKRFAVRPTLIAHQVAHQRTRTANNCTICDKAFDTSSALKVHLRSHNIVKKRVGKRTNQRDCIKGGPAAS